MCKRKTHLSRKKCRRGHLDTPKHVRQQLFRWKKNILKKKVSRGNNLNQSFFETVTREPIRYLRANARKDILDMKPTIHPGCPSAGVLLIGECVQKFGSDWTRPSSSRLKNSRPQPVEIHYERRF